MRILSIILLAVVGKTWASVEDGMDRLPEAIYATEAERVDHLRKEVARLRNQAHNKRSIARALGGNRGGYTKEEVFEEYNKLAPLPKIPELNTAIGLLKKIGFNDSDILNLLKTKYSEKTAEYLLAKGLKASKRGRGGRASVSEGELALQAAMNEYNREAELQTRGIKLIETLKRDGIPDAAIEEALKSRFDASKVSEWIKVVNTRSF